MIFYLETLFKAFRPAFNRKATFIWFVIVFIGFLIRNDTYGVSSIIRALHLMPVYYPNLLHFFHSSAWTGRSLLEYWWQWIVKVNTGYIANNRIVLLGDHTKTVKDGRKMPSVTTLHQDSETGSKPSFFRGHHWGFISLLTKVKNKLFSMPLWAEIHNNIDESRAVRIVTVAIKIAEDMGSRAYLVLDAFFATGPVFKAAIKSEKLIHIITRAKKNIVAYMQPVQDNKDKVGRPRMYGEKIKLMNLFDTAGNEFKKTEAPVYNKTETVKYLTLDLLWKPIKGILRFILVESSAGRIILITSDLAMDIETALHLYGNRTSIETLFNILKNLLGGMKYHFWSKYLKASSRTPKRKQKENEISTNIEKTKNTLAAIEKFVLIQLIVLGTIHLLACKFPEELCKKSNCWLRTPCGEIPSAFVTRTAATNIIRNNLFTFAKNPITQLIISKQKGAMPGKLLEWAA